MSEMSLNECSVQPRRTRISLATNAWESALCAALGRMIRRGWLIVNFPSGRQRQFGEAHGTPIEMTIRDDDALRDLATDPELVMGELYMDERLTIEGDDVDGLVSLLMTNLRELGVQVRSAPAGFRLANGNSTGGNNGEARARRNAAHHYDLSNEFYKLFLDKDLQYSCAYFERESQSIEEAQEAKKNLIGRKLCIQPNQTILDIGCGWGGLVLHLAEHYGARVRGITLSEAQLAAAKARADVAGLASSVDFAIEDYRRTEGRFDRIVSVGMFEHVGRAHFDEYFQTISKRLADDGVALVHTIGRTGGPGATNPWIARRIFPGSYVPALSEVLPAIECSGLCVTDIEIWRLHYARTLRAWRKRFEAAVPRVRGLFDDRFCRMWRFYLAGCEAAFRHGDLVVFQIQLAHRQDAAPLTRDYLLQTANAARQSAEHVGQRNLNDLH